MPKFEIPVPEDYESITRPVAQKVVTDLIKKTGMAEDTVIQYPGKMSAIPQPGSTLKAPFNAPVRFATSDRLWIEIDEEIYENDRLVYPAERPDNVVQFKDEALGIFIKPIYQMMVMKMTIRYRTQDRVSAMKWQNAMQVRVDKKAFDFMHEISYHYPIPSEMPYVLRYLHSLREKVAPLHESLEQWIARCMSPKYTEIVNQAGREPALVIRENQIRTVGFFEFGFDTPVAVRDDTGTGAYEVNLTYSFFYDKPIACAMVYPMMVHNQLISDRFRDNSSQPYDYRQRNAQGSLTAKAYEEIIDPRMLIQGIYGLSVPYFDDWLPLYEPPKTRMLLRMMIQVDPNHPKEIIDLKNLGHYNLHPDVLAYMQADPQGMLTPYQNAFVATLYRSRTPIDVLALTVDNNLNIGFDIDMDVRCQYHLILSLACDLRFFNTAAKTNLMNHGAFFIRLIKAFLPHPASRGGWLPTLTAGGKVTYKDYELGIRLITNNAVGYWNPSLYNSNYVGQFLIKSNRSEQNALSGSGAG